MCAYAYTRARAHAREEKGLPKTEKHLKNAVKTLDTVSHIGYNRQAVLKVRHFSERRDDVRDYFRQNQQGRRELGLTSADKSARLRTACAGLRLMPL